MLFATLGKLDLITVLVLMGAAILPQKMLLFAAVYLLAKGLIFGVLMGDFASKIDLACGAYIGILSFGLYIPVIHTLAFIWLLQKTILTFVAIGVKAVVFYYHYRDRPILG